MSSKQGQYFRLIDKAGKTISICTTEEPTTPEIILQALCDMLPVAVEVLSEERYNMLVESI